MTDQADLTPLMRQYRDIKRAYQDAILFFRVGDFYEMFYEDAEEASRLLSIALTSRDKSRPDPVPLCGVPYHAATAYIAKLLQAGRTVALCDQVEDPKSAKGQGQGQGQGLFRREVVRLYTPGTLTDSELLAPTETSVVAALAPPGSPRRGERGPVLGLAALDLSTGEFSASEFAGDGARGELLDELARLGAKELLYPEDLVDHLRDELTQLKDLRLCAQASARFERATTESLLRAQLGVASLAAFGCEDLTAGLQAAGAVLAYLRETQRSTRLDHVRRLHVRRQGQ